MQSIFESIDKTEQLNYEFWMPEGPSNDLEVFTDQLYEVSKNKIKLGTYTLTKTHLIKLTQNKKSVPIEWKLVIPFVDEINNFKRFGFRLGHLSYYRDFFVSTQEKLDLWLSYFSNISIMIDVENDFNFIRRVGKGKSAHVFLSETIDHTQKYAIKSINKSFITQSASSLEGILNEIKILRKLDHPNIIKLHRVYESESQICLVLDYLEGGDLFSRVMDKSKLPESTVAKLSQNLLRTLEYLDKQKIAHRDIKLENIMMVSKNNDIEFKLVDFGLAHEANENMLQICGSPGYVAPEILRGFKYGTKADTFSVGCVIYILLSGKMPFFGRDIKEIVRKNKEGNVCFRDRVWEHISGEAINLLVKLMEPSPDERVDVQSALLHPWFRRILRRNSNEDSMDVDETLDISTPRGSSSK